MIAGLKPLIKKDFLEFKNNLKSKRGGKFGAVLYALFALLLVSAFVLLYIQLSKAYVFSGVATGASILKRRRELLTISLGVFLIINVIAGVKNIYKKLASNTDAEKLGILPIKDKTIFIYKILYILAKSLATCALTIIPLGIVYGIVCEMGALFYCLLLPLVIVFTLVSVGISAILVVPYYYFKKFTESKYVLLIIISVILMGLAFYVYSILLKALEELLVSGNLMHFFNEHRYGIIEKISNNLFPANIFSSLMLGYKAWLNLLYLILFIVALLVLAIGICGAFYKKISKQESMGTSHTKKELKLKKKSSFISLFSRELIEIVRKPSFAFALFVVAVDLPILVYICTQILNSLVFNLVYLDLSYQIAFFVVLMFAMLANTFCASNISREGKNYEKLTSLPLTKFQILAPKVTLCFMVSFASVLFSVIVLISTSIISPLQGLGIWFVVECMCLAENLFASKYDFRHPNLAKGTLGEGSLSTPSMNVTVIISFMFVLTFAGLIFVYSIFKLLKGGVLSKFIIYGLPCFVGIIMLGICFAYFIKGLNKGAECNEK